MRNGRDFLHVFKQVNQVTYALFFQLNTYIHTYILYPRFIPEGVAEVSQIFLRDILILPKLVSYEEHC
jgi:hypothetical protein